MDGLFFGSSGVWFLIGAMLVWFMNAGFAMLETGFTRAKNAGNIIMKNVLDFCIGTVAFVLLGAGIMLGENALFGLIGLPTLSVFSDFANYDWGNFFFNLVFCATCATIVSGAMAERTKFITYCVYSIIISGIVYPVEAHWVWGGGWLTRAWGSVAGTDVVFIDFAGSAVIHMVGGLSSLIGASMLGARLGKYECDKSGKVVKVRAIPGHNLSVGALGVFILWFGWYGFNGAAASDVTQLAQILVTTTVAAAAGTISSMIVTWVKNGKPDVSMTLNGALAGLVGITAPCAVVDVVGAFFIGLVAGILVVVAVEFIDQVLHVDDPVGAIAVHGVNGLWGALACGLFSTSTGLFYTGSLLQLGVQLLGVVCILAWVAVMMTLTFGILKKTLGLRVSEVEEIEGLDKHEHLLPSAYADFAAVPLSAEILETDGSFASVEAAVPVTKISTEHPNAELTKVVIVTRQTKFEALKKAMNGIGVTGMTVANVMGCGMQKGASEVYRGVPVDITLLPKVKVEIVVTKVPVQSVIDAAKKALYTGHIGDGKIFVYKVDNVVKVRTGEEGYAALQDEDAEE